MSSSKKRKILCKKCKEIGSKKGGEPREGDREKRLRKDVQSCEARPFRKDTSRVKKRGRRKSRCTSVNRRTPNRLTFGTTPQQNRSKRRRDGSSVSAYDTDECSCFPEGSRDRGTKAGILKRRMSSAEVVADYIDSGLDQVASFIVESALRFGKKHGVVVPEKGKSGVYQITSPRVFDERKRSKKIRFHIPEGTLGYEDAKKAMWRRNGTDSSGFRRELDRFVRLKATESKYPIDRKESLGSPSSSIRIFMPILERLKDNDSVVESELDLNKICNYIRQENMKKERKRAALKTVKGDKSPEYADAFTECDDGSTSEETDGGPGQEEEEEEEDEQEKEEQQQQSDQQQETAEGSQGPSEDHGKKPRGERLRQPTSRTDTHSRTASSTNKTSSENA